MTSKTIGNNLPLTTFKVENKPCLDPNDVSRAATTIFYPLEIDRLREDCRIVDQFKEKFDTRFSSMGDIKVNEYDV